MNPDLFIVARANSAEAAPKLRQAGADRVVSPHEIGGSRMASYIAQPNVADFLHEAMHIDELEVELHEFAVDEDSPIAGRTLRDSNIGGLTGATVLAIRRADGTFTQSPKADSKIYAGDVAIVLGTTSQLETFRAWLDGA